MSKAIDPFEEFLRKKKDEKLEQQYRGQKDGAPNAPDAEFEEPAEPQVTVASNDDPVQEARVKEEMAEFFESGQAAGAEAFKEATTMSDDKVGEIKDALDDVFESDTPKPQTEQKGDTFVGFFKQVQEEFDGDGPRPDTTFTPPVEPEAAAASMPLELEPEPEAEAEAAAEPVAETPPPAPLPEPDPAPPMTDLEAAAYEVSSEEEVAAPAPRADGRLSLRCLLAAPDGGRLLRAAGEGAVEGAAALGARAAEDLLGQGGDRLLAELREGAGS